MTFFLAVGLVAFVFVRAARKDVIAVQLLDLQQAGSGQWRATIIVTNQSARVVPTFATRGIQATPQPTRGEPMCWIESFAATGWKRQENASESFMYTRVLFPKSSWRFDTDFHISNQRQRLVLSYFVGRIEMPPLLERLYLAVRRSPVAVWDATPRYLTCDLPVANEAVARTGAAPITPSPK